MHISFRKNPSRILIICALCVVFLIGSVLGHLNTEREALKTAPFKLTRTVCFVKKYPEIC